MEINELVKTASNRTRNANQWLAEGVVDKAKEEMLDLRKLMAESHEILEPEKTDTPEEPEKAEHVEESTGDGSPSQHSD